MQEVDAYTPLREDTGEYVPPSFVDGMNVSLGGANYVVRSVGSEADSMYAAMIAVANLKCTVSQLRGLTAQVLRGNAKKLNISDFYVNAVATGSPGTINPDLRALAAYLKCRVIVYWLADESLQSKRVGAGGPTLSLALQGNRFMPLMPQGRSTSTSTSTAQQSTSQPMSVSTISPTTSSQPMGISTTSSSVTTATPMQISDPNAMKTD